MGMRSFGILFEDEVPHFTTIAEFFNQITGLKLQLLAHLNIDVLSSDNREITSALHKDLDQYDVLLKEANRNLDFSLLKKVNHIHNTSFYCKELGNIEFFISDHELNLNNTLKLRRSYFRSALLYALIQSGGVFCYNGQKVKDGKKISKNWKKLKK